MAPQQNVFDQLILKNKRRGLVEMKVMSSQSSVSSNLDLSRHVGGSPDCSTSKDDVDNDAETIGAYPSKRVEGLVKELTRKMVDYYVVPIYRQMGWYPESVRLITNLIETTMCRLTERLSRVDWSQMVCSTMVRCVQRHFYALKQETEPDGATMLMGDQTEHMYAEVLAERLLLGLVDDRIAQCDTARHVVVAVLAHQVLIPTANYLCDPNTLNSWLYSYLCDRRRSSNRAKRVFYQYAANFERFYSTINAMNDVKELREIRLKIQNELRLVKVLNLAKKDQSSRGSTQLDKQPLVAPPEEGKMDKGQLLMKRDLLLYDKQLLMCLKKVNQRIVVLEMALDAGSLGGTSSSSSPSSERRAKLGKSEKRLLPYATVMATQPGREAFKNYLKNTKHSALMVEFIDMVYSLEASKTKKHLIGREIYDMYVHTVNPIFRFEKALVREMNDFLQGNAEPTAFSTARGIVSSWVESQWYASFVISQEYKDVYARISSHASSEHSSNQLSVVELPEQSECRSELERSFSESNFSATWEGDFEDSLEGEDDMESDYEDDDGEVEDSMEEEDGGKTSRGASFSVMEDSTSHTSEFEDYIVLESSDIPSYRTMDFYRKKLDEVDKKISMKELALEAVQTAQASKQRQRTKYSSELETIRTDLATLRESRHSLIYHISRIDRWTEFHGEWQANIYSINPPDGSQNPALGNSPENKGRRSELTVDILVDLPIGPERAVSSGWMVTHSLAGFAWLRKELAQIYPALAKVPLPSTKMAPLLRPKYTDKYLKNVRRQFNAFLYEVMTHKVLSQSEQVFQFLCLAAENRPPSQDLPVEGGSMRRSITGHLQRLLRLGSGGELKRSASLQEGLSLNKRRRSSAGIIKSLAARRRSSVARIRKVEPLSTATFDLVQELFDLKGSLNLPRRSFMNMVQLLFGKSLSQLLRETVDWYSSEPMLFFYLNFFQSVYFPSTPPQEQPPWDKGLPQDAVKRLLWDNLPEYAKTLFGSRCSEGVGFAYEALQDVRANKALFYSLLEAMVDEAFPMTSP